MNLTVAVLQYDVPDKPEKSKEKLEQMVKLAVKKEARLVVAPETAIGEGMVARDTGEDFFPTLSNIAQKHQVYIATSLYKKEQEGSLIVAILLIPRERRYWITKKFTSPNRKERI